MPNRLIHESARSSKSLDRLSAEAERMFWRLTTVADDFGRFDADTAILGAACFPLSIRQISDRKLEGWISELVAVGVVALYEIGGDRLGYFRSWDKYQQQRAKRSKFPDPPALDSGCIHLPADVSEINTPRSDSNTFSNTNTNPSPNLPEGESEGEPFEPFYSAYPKHEAPQDAKRAWLKLRPSPALLARIMADFPTRYAGIETKYVPQPARYLNGKLWEGDLPVVQPRGSPAGPSLSPGRQKLFESIQRSKAEESAHGNIGSEGNPAQVQRHLDPPADRRRDSG